MHETWWLAHPGALEPGGALARLGLVSVAAATAPPGEARRLSSDRQSAALLLPGPPPLLVKWRHPHGMRRALKAFARPSRERREAWAALTARARGIPTPVPLAVGERRRGGVLLGAVLVRPFFEHMVPADRLLARPDGRALVPVLAAALRRWHDLGFRHGDLYPKNVLVDPGPGEAWPIGFPAARFVAPGTRVDAPRREDLARWAAGLTVLFPGSDPFAFLAAYAESPGLPPPGVLARSVGPRHARVMAKKARRRASQARREPEGPPAPPPLPPDIRPPRRRLRPLEALAHRAGRIGSWA